MNACIIDVKCVCGYIMCLCERNANAAKEAA
jgi:hypothetical protein